MLIELTKLSGDKFFASPSHFDMVIPYSDGSKIYFGWHLAEVQETPAEIAAMLATPREQQLEALITDAVGVLMIASATAGQATKAECERIIAAAREVLA